MDELEIAGKQYISTRRAGREHGYHSDYIGQLIRGKKVQGQKVGRSWYVDAESLAVYLGKEYVSKNKVTSASTAAEEVPATDFQDENPIRVEEVPVVEQAVVEEKEVQEEVPTPVAEIAPVIAEPIAPTVVEEKIIEPAPVVEEERKVPLHTAVSPIEEEEKILEAKHASGLVYVHDDAPSLPQVRTAASDAYTATPMAKAAVAFAPQSSLSLSKSLALASILGLALVMGVGAAAYLSLNVRVVDQTATSYFGIQR